MGIHVEKLERFILAELEGVPSKHPDRGLLARILKTATHRVKEEERRRTSLAAGTLSKEGRIDTDALAKRINRECGKLKDETSLLALYNSHDPEYQNEVPEEWKNVMDTLTSRERVTIRRAIGSVLRANLKSGDVPPIETVGDWRTAQTYNSKVVNRIRTGTREFLMITFRNVEAEGEIPRSA